MSNDINHLDAENLGLKAIFGDRFQDQTVAPKAQKKMLPSSVSPRGLPPSPKGKA